VVELYLLRRYASAGLAAAVAPLTETGDGDADADLTDDDALSFAY